MNFRIVLSAAMAFSLSSPALSQQYEPLSEVAVNGMAGVVLNCFRDATSERVATDCLYGVSSVIEVTGAFNGPQLAATMGSHDISRVLDQVLSVEYQKTILALQALDDDGDVATFWDPAVQGEVPYLYEETFRVAQRAWGEFRDAECRVLRATSLGQAVYGMVYEFCVSSFTKTRIMDLILIRMEAYAPGEYLPKNFAYED